MAIFGDFSELPFPEILSTLGRRSGRLHVQTGAHSYVLHLEGDRLLALSANGTIVHDPVDLREVILFLAQQTEGRFEFHRDEPDHLAHHHRIAVTQLLLSTSAIIDELDHYRDRLAPPETRFVLHESRHEVSDPALSDFLGRAHAPLADGASAQDLARALGMQVERVQLALYKLRTAGIVMPLRAFAPPVSAPPRPAPAPAPAFGAAPVLAAVAVAAPPVAPPPAPRESPGLVSRLLGALRSRRWFA